MFVGMNECGETASFPRISLVKPGRSMVRRAGIQMFLIKSSRLSPLLISNFLRRR